MKQVGAVSKIAQSLSLPFVFVAIAHGMRLLSALMIIKLVSVYAGPEGLGRLGLFMSVVSLTTVFAGGGISNGIIKYVAEYRDSPKQLEEFLGSAVLYGLIYSMAIIGICSVFSFRLAALFFGDAAFWWIMPTFGFAQLFAFIGVVVVGTANGMKRHDLFARLTAISYFVAIIVSYMLISNWGTMGGIAALGFTMSCVGILGGIAAVVKGYANQIRLRFDRSQFRLLSRFSIMMITAAVLFPVSEILIRNAVEDNLGLTFAGYWQGLTRLSTSYIGFFAVFLGTVFMPRLSGTHSLMVCRQLVTRQLLRTGTVFVASVLVMYLLRDFLIVAAFSNEFSPLSKVIHYQFIGDFFRILSYVVGFLFLSKAAVGHGIAAEIFQYVLYTTLTITVINSTGQFDDVVQSYAISYAIYFCVMIAALYVFTARDKK